MKNILLACVLSLVALANVSAEDAPALTMGGQMRFRYEAYNFSLHNAAMPARDIDQLHLRTRLNATLRLPQDISVFIQLQDTR
ncbi:MAG: hypothetical protein AABZ44_05990, partial [Elusimicrobiota bacterium]